MFHRCHHSGSIRTQTSSSISSISTSITISRSPSKATKTGLPNTRIFHKALPTIPATVRASHSTKHGWAKQHSTLRLGRRSQHPMALS